MKSNKILILFIIVLALFLTVALGIKIAGSVRKPATYSGILVKGYEFYEC